MTDPASSQRLIDVCLVRVRSNRKVSLTLREIFENVRHRCDGLQFCSDESLQFAFNLLLDIRGQRDATLFLDDSQHCGAADACGAASMLERIDRDSVASQKSDISAVVEGFAIDKSAVAIERDTEHGRYRRSMRKGSSYPIRTDAIGVSVRRMTHGLDCAQRGSDAHECLKRDRGVGRSGLLMRVPP